MTKNLLLFLALSCSVFSLSAQVNFKLKQTSYVGAFSADAAEDWTKNWANFDPKNTVYAAPTDLSTLNGMDASLPIPGEKLITGTLTLDASKSYLLTGFIVVKDGGKLVIPAGTIIHAQSNLASSPKNYASIVVERGGKIEILGTANSPVVITSAKAPGSRERGDWGGLVIGGRAPHNLLNGTTNDNVQMEGFNGVSFDNTLAKFGGTDPNDNSGIIRYLRLEFGGLAFEVNREINGLTLGGVGAGTEISHVQVSFSNDDSFEWFGGNVNSSNLIAWKGTDDDFDTDNGYLGVSQFGLAVRDSAYYDGTWNAPSGASTSEGFESDNEATGTASVKPYTGGIFSNYTMVGPIPVGSKYSDMNSTTKGAFRRGARIRRNSSLRIVNSFFTGYRNFVMIDGDSSVRNTNWPQALALVKPTTPVDVPTKQIFFTNNLICSTAAAFTSTTDTTANGLIEVARAKGSNDKKLALDAWIRQTTFPSLANQIDPAPCGTSALLVNALASSTTPDFRPVAGSPVLSGANFLGNPILAPITKVCAVASTASATNVTCPNDATGTATATVTGGTAPFSYAWSNGQTANPATNLSAGSISVVITDAEGCQTSASATVQAIDNVAPTVTCPANIAVCEGSAAGTLGLAATAADNCAGVTTTKTGTWQANDIYPVGVTTLGFEATDAAGNKANCSFTVTVHPNPSIAVGSTTNETAGLSNGAISINLGNGPFSSILWKKNGANFATTEDLTGITAGDYQVVVTTANGCVSTSAVITIQNIVGTHEVSAADAALKIQPNPVSDKLLISSNLEVVQAIQVADADGRILISQKGNIQEVDFSKLPAAVYSLRIRFADGSFATRRVVKI